MKAIVGAAGGVEKVLKDVGEAGGAANNDAGKLFAGSAGAADGADAADVGKAVAAVNAVSGEQILKAIVEAAGGADKVGGAAANTANNPIAAAIGTDGGNGAAFADNGMQNKNDKIAAAIVLRGMAKGGKFSLAAQNDAHKAGVKSAAQSGTAKTVNALTSIIQKAAEEGLKKVADAVKGIAASGKLFADAAGDYGKIFRLFENHLDSFLEFRVLGSAKISFKAHEPILKIALDY